MNDVKSWIEERRAIHTKATEGPWAQERIHHRPESEEPHWCWEINDQDGYPIITELREDEDDAEELATAIVDAHQNFPRALDALNKVLELHVPETEYGPDYYSGKYPCVECNRSDQEGLHPTLWPCPTIQAIEGAIAGLIL